MSLIDALIKASKKRYEHASHQMHENSLECYDEEEPNFGRMESLVYQLYRASAVPLTDRQVKTRLGFTDMNKVRPRITELIKDGYLFETGSTQDETTLKKVRLVHCQPPPETATDL